MGRINVTAENIFPIIKKFLYSDHEIFLRELVSNAVDATLKLKTLSRLGEIKGELGELTIDIKIDKEAGTLTISDHGVGMTEDEVNKYINEVAFSGAEEFLEQYKDKASDSGIIGHFGLGFYSAFMVADKVEIRSKSARLESAGAEGSIHWECKGDPEFEFSEGTKEERGTEVVLHINEDNKEFLEDQRLTELLKKYCRFLPIPIQFGTKEEKITSGEGEDAKEETIVLPNYINNPIPAWTKSPSELKDEEYQAFYSELYPTSFEKPLFHIHLNVDYPFNLNGILYFPRIKPNMELNRNKIQLYQNQVFVTDSVEGIVPDFLTLLHGVIDSKDIPLNVSRSYLQADGNVKKISGHITKKVADRLEEMFKNDRPTFEKNWDDTKMIIEYGMLSEEKFYDRAKKFFLLKDTDGAYHTIEEFKAKVENIQKNKEDNTIWLYASDLMAQHSGIEEAKAKGYHVLLLNSPLNAHLTDRLERDLEKVQFARVDSDSIDRIINKEDEAPSKLTEEQEKELLTMIESAMEKDKFKVEIAKLSSDAAPIQIHVPEFMRRMKEMSATGGGGFMGMTDFPETYQVVVNANHPLSELLLNKTEEERGESLVEAIDLALLGQNLLHGAALSTFIKRTQKQLEQKLGV